MPAPLVQVLRLVNKSPLVYPRLFSDCYFVAVSGGYLFLLFKGRDLVSSCPLALGVKPSDFKRPMGFQSQMLIGTHPPSAVPRYLGCRVWGLTSLCI